MIYRADELGNGRLKEAMLGTHRRIMIRLCFVVEATTDVRMLDGLAESFDLTVVARASIGERVSNRPASRNGRVVFLSGNRLGFSARVARYLLRSSADVDFVLVQGYGLAAIGANIASRLSSVPAAMLVCSPVGAYYECRRRFPVGGKRYRALGAAAIRFFALLNARIGGHYVTLSEHLSDTVREFDPDASIQTIPVYGVDTSCFRPAVRSKGEIRGELGLPVDAEVVIFSSRIAPEKDTNTLLTAIAALLRKRRKLVVLNASGGHEMMREAAKRLGISESVVTMAAVHPCEQLPSLYQAADLCVQASREEGLGFSVLEALACEVPVVATYIGGLRETIVDGETGWTYRMGDPESLRKAIEDCLDHPEEAARRACRGRVMVQRRYEAKRSFGKLADWISQQCVSSPKHGSSSRL